MTHMRLGTRWDAYERRMYSVGTWALVMLFILLFSLIRERGLDRNQDICFWIFNNPFIAPRFSKYTSGPSIPYSD